MPNKIPFISIKKSYEKDFYIDRACNSLPQSQKAMPVGRQVSIIIFDMNGRLIKTLADAQMQAGTHQLTWKARDEKGNIGCFGNLFVEVAGRQLCGNQKDFCYKINDRKNFTT